jgi:glycosyltransferase involved in cell wall biosynthesis/tetratricopeptide (TPR) repeat protein
VRRPKGFGVPESENLPRLPESPLRRRLAERGRQTRLSFALAASSPFSAFPAAGYRDAHPDLEQLSDAEALRHFLLFGLHEGRQLPLAATDQARLLTEIIEAFAPYDREVKSAAERRLAQLSLPAWTADDARTYRLLNPELASLDDEAAGAHFQSTGCRELRLVNPAYRFDPEFYRDYYDDLRQFSDADAYRHWMAFGRHEGRMPSEAQLCRHLGLREDRIPPGFQAETYLSGAPDLNHLSRTRLFEHLIVKGVPEGRPLPFSRREDAAFVRDLGSLWSGLSEEAAHRCFEAALLLDADDPEILTAFGDFNLVRKNLPAALWQYEAAKRLRPDHIWTLINLGLVREQLGQADEAISNFELARRARPDWPVTYRVLKDAATKRFRTRMSDALELARTTDARTTYTEVASASSQFLELFEHDHGPPRTERTTSEAPRVAFYNATMLRQCFLYRVVQKVEQARQANLHFDVYEGDETELLAQRLFEYDVLWLYRAYVNPDVLSLIAAARHHGIPVVYETDDLHFDLDAYPPPFDSMRNHVSDADYARFVLDAPCSLAVLELADWGVASTPALQKAMAARTRTKTAFLHRNGLSQVHRRAISAEDAAGRDEQSVRIFYGSGSKSHDSNFNEIVGTALAAVMLREPRIKLVIVGDLDLDRRFLAFGSRVEQLSSRPNISDYWDLLRGADINICPLTDGPFNDAKSEIKWLEAAMLGVPSIVSASATYKEVIDNGVDGLLASTHKEWEAGLTALCTDATLRRKLGQAAKARVLREYSTDRLADNLKAIAANLLPRERVPRQTVPLRILVVNVFYAPQAIGGATRVVEANVADISALAEGGIEFEVFCTTDAGERPGAVDRYTHAGVDVIAFTVPADPSGESEERNVFVEDAFRRTLERFKPDLVHIHCIQRLTASVVDATARAGVPYVVTVHDGWWVSDEQFLFEPATGPVYETGRWGSPRRLERLRAALNGAEQVLAVSDTFAQLYKDRGVERVATCSNGVNEIEGPVGWPAGPHVCVGLLGGIGPAKGSDLLREALQLEKFANLQLFVVDHHLQPGVEKRAAWGLNEVILVGPQPHERVAAIYGRLHVVLAPSVCVESFGLTSREALSLGRWVVASNRGAIGEPVIENVNGFTIDVSNCMGLATALRRLNESPERFLRPIDPPAGMRTARDQARDLLDIYKSVLHTAAR